MMNKLRKLISDTILVVIGNAVLAFGVAVFAVPSRLIYGGATGLSFIIEHFTSFNYATVVFVINMFMLVLGFVVLGKSSL